MKWTKRPPTEPGWYWRKHLDIGYKEVILVMETANDIIACCGMGFLSVTDPQFEWAGPIPEPEE